MVLTKIVKRRWSRCEHLRSHILTECAAYITANQVLSVRLSTAKRIRRTDLRRSPRPSSERKYRDEMLRSRPCSHLITDCMRAAGMGGCESMLGEFPVIVKNNFGSIKDDGWSLTEASRTHPRGSKRCKMGALRLHTKLLPWPALFLQNRSVSTTFADASTGYPADFIVLDDELQLKATYLDGKAIFRS